MKSRVSTALGLVFGLVLSGGAPAFAQLTGAIFTTVSDGTAVNANIYDSKCSVYLDGGPGPHAPARAAGLPDGDYYFQVTDPSGKQLLSTDPVSNRKFTVSNGVIVAYTGTSGPAHPIGIDAVHPELNGITIQMANISCPTDFLDSPNGGGEYKAWVTPVGAFSGDPTLVDYDCGNGCYHGFLPRQSKTDNFKARNGTATFCVTVQSQLQDGTAYTQPLITITDPLGVDNGYYTDTTGQLQVCGLTEGSYTVAIGVPSFYVVGLTVNNVAQPTSPSYTFTWSAGQTPPVIVYVIRPPF